MAHKHRDSLNTLAKIAAAEFLGKSKTSLNTSLKKIAKDEGLNRHQVEYVAAEANKAVWADLFEKDKKASYDFDVADANAIVGDLQVKPQNNIIKEASLDYLKPPSRIVHEKTASGSVDDGEDRTPANRRAVKRELEKRAQKMEMAKEELERRMMVEKTAQEDLQKAFVKEAKRMVMETPFSERGDAMDAIAEFVRSSAPDDFEMGRELMAKLSSVVRTQGLVKQADMRAPEEYIAKGLPARIVNGREALYITIDTLRKNRDEFKSLRNAYTIVDDTLPELKEKIRAL